MHVLISHKNILASETKNKKGWKSESCKHWFISTPSNSSHWQVTQRLRNTMRKAIIVLYMPFFQKYLFYLKICFLQFLLFKKILISSVTPVLSRKRILHFTAYNLISLLPQQSGNLKNDCRKKWKYIWNIFSETILNNNPACFEHPVHQRKFIVFKKSLDELILLIPWQWSSRCSQPIKRIVKKKTGSFISVYVECTAKHY